MTLVCAVLTDEFALLSCDTHVSNENGTSRTRKKIFKYGDILIGGSGSGAIIDVIPKLMGDYQLGTAYRHMQAIADFFKNSEEKVMESRYSQFLYVSKDVSGPFFGVVDTKGDHKTLKKNHDQPMLRFKGIGEPDEELLKSCISPQQMERFNIDIAKKIHEDYITKVSQQSTSVNDFVIHEELFYK